MEYNIITSFRKIEDIEKLKEAGATTMVLGIPFFSVRSTHYLNDNELIQAIKKCNELGLKKYFLLNRFFVEGELNKLKEQLAILKNMDIDGIYYTDMAVYNEAKKIGIENLLIYNPDTILTNSNDLNAYLQLGIKGCVVSKEITLEEILKIASNVEKGKLEIYINGYLNMMHSKRNLLTNYMDFLGEDKNLKNRNDLVLKEEHREELMPVLEDEYGTHIFTGYRLECFDEIKDIVNSGITNLKVESLFEDIDDLCLYIQAYRAILEDKIGSEQVKEYFYNQDKYHFDSGFMYKKTGLLK